MTNVDDIYKNNRQLIDCETIKDCKQYIDIMLDCMFSVVINTNPRYSELDIQGDAKIMLQMFYLKCMNVKCLIDGCGFEQKQENQVYTLSPIVDYASIFSLVRSLYEAFCAFELIFVLPDTKEKRLIMYESFQIQGYQERQSYYHSSCYVKQKENEAILINVAKQNIRNTDLYKNLSTNTKNAIEQNHTFWRYFDNNNEIHKFKKETDYILFGIKTEVFENMYSYFSLYSHPSYISIIQFKDAFNDNIEQQNQFVSTAVRNIIVLMSFIIADFCELFPTCNDLIKSMDKAKRNLVFFFDNDFRDKKINILPLE